MRRADVKLETGQERVLYDDTKHTAEKVAAAIDKLGFKASIVFGAASRFGWWT